MLAGYQQEKIWGPAIRLWHWALVFSVTAGWLLGEFRSFSTMQWHMYAGYTTGTLLLIRVYLGFAGPSVSRFTALMVKKSDTKIYLRKMFVKQPGGEPGHNPIGALSVIAMLSLLAIQVISGLFSEDDGLFSEGPFANTVSDAAVLSFTSVHSLNSRAILVLVGLHISAILYYLIWKKENLTRAMITGWKLVKKPQ